MKLSSLTLFREEKDGKASTTRVIFFLWAIIVLAVWAIISLLTSEVQPIPAEVAAILGVLAGGKAIQRFAER